MGSAYLVDATRTPFGRHGGALAGVRADDLAALPIAALMARHPALDRAALDEVILGCANQAGEDNRNVARMAVLLSGLPREIPGVTVNRLCASGLEAVGQAARAIACGEADLVIAGGVESMSRAPYVMAKAGTAFARDQQLEDTTLGWRLVNPRMQGGYGVDSMTQTAENLAREHRIDRDSQDAYALRSQQRAAHAQRQGWLAEEITPVDAPRGKETVRVQADEPPRPDSSAEKLAALKPLLGPGTSITAGNASGLNDGAAALLLASERALARHRLEPLARVVGMASAGVAPRVMGIGPVPAIRKLLARTGLGLADFDRIEINEAFAAQVLACTRALDLPDDAAHVNANGGAIALGHPLGASGARLAMTAAFALRRHRERRALVSLCVGVGQGLAMALERPS
ncbi:beta-ketoadipyl CoA thiolase [Mizugakiibacter sediminis]|uniref:Beta-ketoadipyl-CoA thiolase n=1 Tax=Mizugakiibacter sediminis TaxID=1475481 RepID=A0A0K8QS82_9GAMM|nr:3-oxoadipyl-CoA thiolase [Mizugakiibacter sediminis]GAP67506.1 beta-ketoadipyl CoA thiolase [Mizugakiibacter sediminis]